jgi:hypothetical protein
MRGDRRNLIFLVLVMLIAGIASLWMVWITAEDPGVDPDSIVYIETTQSLLADEGFFSGGQPTILFPPGYPILLAVASLAQGGDLLQAARFLCVLFFAANAALLGLAVFIVTERNLLAAGLVMIFFLVSAPMLSIQMMAWSEAPFITLALATLILVSRYITRPNLYLLVAIALILGFALVTRYIGVTLLLPVVFALLVLGNLPLKNRLYRTFFVVVVALLPLAAWFVRNSLVTGTTTGRSLTVHLFERRHARQFIESLFNFVFPISGSGWLMALALGAALVIFLTTLAFLLWKRHIRRNTNSIHDILMILCVVFTLAYFSFLVFSVSFFDALTPLNARLLSPAFLATLIASMGLAWSASKAFNRKSVWFAFLIFLFFAISINSPVAAKEALLIHEQGKGFTSLSWENSPTIAWVRSLDQDVHIYSNGADVIRFLTGKQATMIPRFANPQSRKPNPDFDMELSALCGQVENGAAIVVYFNLIDWRWFLPAQQVYESECGTAVSGKLADGVIYGQ